MVGVSTELIDMLAEEALHHTDNYPGDIDRVQWESMDEGREDNTYMYTYICIYTHIDMRIRIHIYIYMCTYIYIYVHGSLPAEFLPQCTGRTELLRWLCSLRSLGEPRRDHSRENHGDKNPA